MSISKYYCARRTVLLRETNYTSSGREWSIKLQKVGADSV